MKIRSAIILFFALATLTACRKDDDGIKKYGSLKQFYADNQVAMQTFIVNGATGGTFTTPQGTTIIIPPYAFQTDPFTLTGNNVTIEFKDLYKKSDIFFSGIPTQRNWMGEGLMKSAGEFFIRAVGDSNEVVNIALGKKIDVKQPFLVDDELDSAMQAFVALDTFGMGGEGNFWQNDPSADLFYSATNYIFSLYRFSDPVSAGTWCNSDNSSYFASFPQITLTLRPADTADFHAEVYLVFKNENSMVHIYQMGDDFPYYYAPSGLECSVVAVGLKDSLIYSSFVPITISNADQTVDFTFSPTTAEEFKAKLEELN